MTIGFVENYLQEDWIVFWFYRYVNGRWAKAHTEKVKPSQREKTLTQVRTRADLVPLSRGT
jgi:hypothetical protein